MKRWLGALVLGLVGVAKVGATCATGDTVVVVPTLSPGASYEPAVLNQFIKDCAATNLDVTVQYNGDTLTLGNPLVSDRANKTLSLRTRRTDTLTTPVTLTRPSNSPSGVLFVSIGNSQATLENTGFARRPAHNVGASIVLRGRGSIVRDCYFYTAADSALVGNDTSVTLIKVEADSVLIERNVFRAPIADTTTAQGGRTLAISSGAASGRLEIRSNLFVSTGLHIQKSTTHLYANTFVGSRNRHSFVVFGTGVTSNTELRIWNNLFAAKFDARSAIYFDALSQAQADGASILRNAYALSGNGGFIERGSPITAANPTLATGADANTRMTEGFSNYANSDLNKEYPLVQLRTAPSLVPSHADFGKVPPIFNNYPGPVTSIAAWASTASHFYFPPVTFKHLYPLGSSWTPGIRVGCFINLDSWVLPSPLDSLAVVRAADTTQIKVSRFRLDPLYYDSVFSPTRIAFLMGTTPAAVAATDTSAATPLNSVFLNYPMTDSILRVPNALRTGNTLYVKALHFNANGRAALIGNVPVVSVANVPAFPVNDLVAEPNTDTSLLNNGNLTVTVTKGKESVDSVRVIVSRESGVPIDTVVRVFQNPSPSVSVVFNLSQLGIQKVRVSWQPIALLNGVSKVGPTLTKAELITVNNSASKQVYVSTKATCTGARGTPEFPFCSIDDALAQLKTLGGGAIYILASSGPFENVVVGGTDTATVYLLPAPEPNGKYPVSRPVFRGTATASAITLSRKNFHLSGLLIEMPGGASNTLAALSIQATAGNNRIEACLFRPTTPTTIASAGAAIQIQGAAANIDCVNNVIWGYSTALAAVGSSASKLRFVNNTVIEDRTKFGESFQVTGFKVSGSSTFTPLIASNLFANVRIPMDTSLKDKGVQLANNVYTSASPNLQSLSEAGGLLDPVSALGTLALDADDYSNKLDAAFKTKLFLDYGQLDPANSLLAGSASISDTLALNDFFGNPRIGKREVGAIEFASKGVATPLAYLTVRVQQSDTAPDKAVLAITSRNFDDSLADSVVYKYTLGSSPNQNVLGTKTFGLADLNGAGISQAITGLEGKKVYYFWAAAKKGNTTGYFYADSLNTGVVKVMKDVAVSASKPAQVFPSEDGVFVDSTGGWEGRVVFSDSIQSGKVCAPKVSALPVVATGLVTGGAPKIYACVENDEIGKSGSELKWTLTLSKLKGLPEGLESQHLFAFPVGGGLPVYVPTWRIERTDALANLVIEGQWSGAYDYQFGNFNAAVNRGSVSPSVAKKLDYRGGDKDTVKIPVTFQGNGFLTANPIVLAVPVPAGGILSISPMHSSYFSRAQVLTKGLAGLGTTLKENRLKEYLARVSAVDTTFKDSIRPWVVKLPTVGAENVNRLNVVNGDVAVDLAGSMAAQSLELPFLPEKSRAAANWGGWCSRSVEVHFITFDGGRMTRSNAYIQTVFDSTDLTNSDGLKQPINGKREFPENTWNLLSYPWDETLESQMNLFVGEQSSWNNDNMLVYRYTGKGTGKAAFDMYRGGSTEGWGYDSARALWAASRKSFTPISRLGQSNDMQAFSLSLPAGQWTLFGLPFNFPMYWGDIAQASNPVPTINAFAYDPTRDAPWQALADTSVVYPWQGLAIKPLSATVLVFPVVDINRSPVQLKKKVVAKAAAQPGSWSAEVLVANNSTGMSLRIGKAEQSKVDGEVPWVPNQNFRADLVGSQGMASQVIASLKEGREGIWPLSLHSVGDSREPVRITLRFNQGEALPIYLYEATTQAVTPLTQGEAITLSLDEADTKNYSLVAGEGMLQQALSKGMSAYMLRLGNFPNPFGTSTRIRYDLPAQHKDVTYSLRVSDMTGRVVFTYEKKAGASFDFTWNGETSQRGTLAAGHYKLNLTAKTPSGTVFKARRNLLKL